MASCPSYLQKFKPQWIDHGPPDGLVPFLETWHFNYVGGSDESRRKYPPPHYVAAKCEGKTCEYRANKDYGLVTAAEHGLAGEFTR